MATTTKKSPKAKIKTTKKPVTKAAKATNKKVTSKIVEAKLDKPVKTTKVTKAVPFTKKLNILNLASGFLSLALAAAAGFLMNNTSYQLFTGLITKDELASANGTAFVPAIRALHDLELRWVVVGILLLSAIVPLLAATRNRKQYETALANKVIRWRWIEMAVISALIVETIALVSGVQDVMTLKLIGGMTAISLLLAWISERQVVGIVSRLRRNTYALSIVTGILPWLLIVAYTAATVVYGRVRAPWFVYALHAVGLISLAAYYLNGKRELQASQNYEVTERNYLRISIFFKVAFAAILIVGLYKK